jgi:AraC-like DNA-binding protein
MIFMEISNKGKYYGAKKSATYLNGIVLSEYDYLESETPWHFHENPYFMYVLNGQMKDYNKKQSEICEQGSLIFHNWQEPHYNTRESKFARGFHVEFDRQWYNDKKLDVALWEGSQLIQNPISHHILGKLYLEFKCNDRFSEVSIDLLLLQLCESLETQRLQNTGIAPPWIPHLKALIYANNEDLSLEYLSDQLGIHPVHISRAVPKYLSTTLGDYIRQQKIKMALGYMMDPHLTLTEIAFSSGFSDQSHFIRIFKHYCGTTPRVFRRQLLEG